MATAKVVVRLKPRLSTLDHAVQSVDRAAKPTLLIRKGDKEDGVYQFNFTRVLADASQQETYQVCGKEIVESVQQGYNGTIMAYGQTGSGKTFTMAAGSLPTGEEAIGIIPRALQQLFRGLQNRDVLHWRVRLSYLEIYNDAFTDLLALQTPSSELSITDSKGVMSVKNAKYVDCSNVREALAVVKEGQANRQVAAHALNNASSRSHTILSIWLDVTNADGQSLASKLNLVDLAGSERFTKTGAQGATAREAVHINKSLTFLEQTVIALARKRQHVPFRSSKLTHFLKDSIGDNCRTMLIACIWSDAAQISETLSTCRFAQRMLQVTEDAHQNKGGLSSVHGNLFKLDPVMQQYLESMTAAAVAREKTQLYAEFARLSGSHAKDLGSSEFEELETLRMKVKYLEQQQRAANQMYGQLQVDESSLAEMNTLRQRVLQLEEDIAAAKAASSKQQPTCHLELGQKSQALPAVAKDPPTDQVSTDSSASAIAGQHSSALLGCTGTDSFSESSQTAHTVGFQEAIHARASMSVASQQRVSADTDKDTDVTIRAETTKLGSSVGVPAKHSSSAAEDTAGDADLTTCTEPTAASAAGKHQPSREAQSLARAHRCTQSCCDDHDIAATACAFRDENNLPDPATGLADSEQNFELSTGAMRDVDQSSTAPLLAATTDENLQEPAREDGDLQEGCKPATPEEGLQPLGGLPAPLPCSSGDTGHLILASDHPTASQSSQLQEEQSTEVAMKPSGGAARQGDAAHLLAQVRESASGTLPEITPADPDELARAISAGEQFRMTSRVDELEVCEQRIREYSAAHARLAMQGGWRPPSEIGSGPSQSLAGDWDAVLDSSYDTEIMVEAKQKKRGLFARLFGKRQAEEHDSFAHFAPPDAPKDEAPTPNIVILNSLNHSQLLELLKARPLKNSPEEHCLHFPGEGEMLGPFTPEHSTGRPCAESSVSESAASLLRGAYQTSPEESPTPSSMSLSPDSQT